MSLKNSKYFELIKQNIDTFKLNLNNYNVLLPALPKEPALLAVIASMAGAKNVYVQTNKLPLCSSIPKESSSGRFIAVFFLVNPINFIIIISGKNLY